jgi:hypothetical protein
LNFSLLSDFINKNSSEEDSIFSGEISDGVHNLGFSQFATILDHPDLDFREYADKMACYMFSPSFIKTILDGNYQKDIVYNFLKNRSSNSIFDNIDGYDKTDLFIKILSSFFIYPKRFPFYSMDNSAILSQKARKEYSETYQKIYLREISEKLSPEKIYSAIIYLYNSFHWQGSTVKVIGKSLERYNKQIKLPFWDISVQNFLSQMPESWGRGLDLKNTKYPLKWVLKNKINYPLHLQKGPHSYLYDVNPGFSHLAETLYGSAMNSFFREILKSGKYKNALDSDYFNLNYIKEIIESFNSGEELSGQKLNDIGSLILLSLII